MRTQVHCLNSKIQSYWNESCKHAFHSITISTSCTLWYRFVILIISPTYYILDTVNKSYSGLIYRWFDKFPQSLVGHFQSGLRTAEQWSKIYWQDRFKQLLQSGWKRRNAFSEICRYLTFKCKDFITMYTLWSKPCYPFHSFYALCMFLDSTRKRN